MRLIDLIANASSVKYTDAVTGNHYSLKQLTDHNLLKPFESQRHLSFLYVDNSICSIATVLSLFDSDHVIVLLNPKLKQSLKEKLEKLYTPFFIFDTERESVENYRKTEWLFNTSLFFNSESEAQLHPRLKLLLSTSGTTGSPKFVKLSEENIVSNALSITDYLPIKSDDIVPLNLPVYYSYGLSVLTSNSISGCNIVCTNKDILQKEFWVEMDKFNYSTLAGVPYFYEMLNRLGFTKKNYPSLRYITQAGGKLNEKLMSGINDHCLNYNIEFYVMYGQTEATARMSYLSPSMIRTKLGSIGKPIKNGSFSIDETTSELIYRGPNVFGGYAESIKDLSTFSEDMILNTGDVARVDEDGYYYITGRLKRFVKLFGNRVNLDEVEQILKNKFVGSQFACTSYNDQYLLVFQAGVYNIESEQVTQFIFDTLKLHPTVIKNKLIDDFPLTSNGKIDYGKLSATFAAEKNAS